MNGECCGSREEGQANDIPATLVMVYYIYFTRGLSPSDPGVGVKRSKSFFSDYGHITYQIKGNGACSNSGRKRFNRRSPHDPGVRSKGQNSTFSEHGHVAYQIKCIHKCSDIIANILPADPILTFCMNRFLFFSRTCLTQGIFK